jgi:hypothetical protein
MYEYSKAGQQAGRGYHEFSLVSVRGAVAEHQLRVVSDISGMLVC